MNSRPTAQANASLLWVLAVTSFCACSSSSSSNASNPMAGRASAQSPAATCTSLGQEILKASPEHAETKPLVSFYGIAGVSDEEFAKRRQEYEACATPILATVKEQLFGKEHVRAVEEAARTQPDLTALDHQLEEEEASAWRQIDAATLQIAMQCGQQPGSFVRRYEYAGGNITETDDRLTTIKTDRNFPWPENAVPLIWRRRHLESGFYPVQNCVSARPAARCVEYHNPIHYDPSFDWLPTIDDATNKTQLVCRFTFAGKARGRDDNDVHGKGVMNLATRRVQFIPD